jgi:hypothetical protein
VDESDLTQNGVDGFSQRSTDAVFFSFERIHRCKHVVYNIRCFAYFSPLSDGNTIYLIKGTVTIFMISKIIEPCFVLIMIDTHSIR